MLSGNETDTGEGCFKRQYPDLHECLQLCKQMWMLIAFMHESRHTLVKGTEWGVVVYLVYTY